MSMTFRELVNDRGYVDLIEFVIVCKNNGIDLDAASSRAVMYKGQVYTWFNGYVMEDNIITMTTPVVPARRGYNQVNSDSTANNAIDVCKMIAHAESVDECKLMIGMLESRIRELK